MTTTSGDGIDRLAVLVELKRWAEASALASERLALDPHDSRALCYLGQARIGLEDPAGALESAEAAVAADPQNEWGYRLGSIAAQQLGRLDLSISMAGRAVRVAPHVAQAHARFARALVAGSRDLTTAAVHADRAVALAPGSVESHLAMSSVALSGGRVGDAEAACRRALAIDPDDAAAQNELARVSLKRSRLVNPAGLARAATGFSSALRVDPGMAAARHNVDVAVYTLTSWTTYMIFLAAFVGTRVSGGTNVPRWAFVVPVIILIAPLAFVGIFLHRVSPALRAYALSSATRPTGGFPALGIVVSVVLLIAGAVFVGAAFAFFSVAFLCVFLARLGLWADARRRGIAKGWGWRWSRK